jgi:hypothetical protein
MAINTKGGRRREKRLEKRREKRNPKPQYYGGDKEAAAELRERDQTAISSGGERETYGLEGMAAERANSQARVSSLDQRLTGERSQASQDLRGISDRIGAERAAAGTELGGLSASVAAERARAGTQFENLGLKVAAERAAAGTRSNALRAGVAQERAAGGQQFSALGNEAAAQQARQRIAQSTYGGASNQAFSDYRGGRAAQLGGADELAALGRGAQGRYMSAADAAFKAATERSQRNALSLAAGRGPDAIRTALATSQASNQEAALAAEATRANEMNALLALEGNAIQGASNIRSGVGAQDLQAAQAQAQREQSASGDVNRLIDTRSSLAGANANLGLAANQQVADINKSDADTGLAATAQRSSLAGADANLGLAAGGLRSDIAQANAGLGLQAGQLQAGVAETNAGLGLQTAAQRAELERLNTGTGLAVSGAVADAGAGQRGQFLGAEAAREGAQLGANQVYEQQRAAQQKDKLKRIFFDPANLFSSMGGG